MSDVEHREQRSFFKWASMQSGKFPELTLLYAIPNGGDRNARVGAKLKAEGVKAGFPDIGLPVPRGGYGGLFIEMKRPGNKAIGQKKGRLRKNQRQWLRALEKAGNMTAVAYGWEDARKHVLNYLSMKPGDQADQESPRIAA